MGMPAPCLCPHCEKLFDVDLDGGFDDIYNDTNIICEDCNKYQQKDYKESIEQAEIVGKKSWDKIQKIKGKMIIKVLRKAN